MYARKSQVRQRGALLHEPTSRAAVSGLFSQEEPADNGVPPVITNQTTSYLLWAFIYCACCVGLLLLTTVIVLAVKSHHHDNTPAPNVTVPVITATTVPPLAETDAATQPQTTTTTTIATTQPPATVGETPVHPADVTIELLCNVPFGNGTCRAIFSYENARNVPLAIPVGENNHISPGWQDRGQPKIFASGLRYGAASFLWDCAASSHVHWIVRSGLSNALTMASASSYAVDCPALPIHGL